jgi:hypothetical protein
MDKILKSINNINPKPPIQAMRRKSSFRTINIKKNMHEDELSFRTNAINIKKDIQEDEPSFRTKTINIKKDTHITKCDFDIYMKCFIHELQTPVSTISLGLNLLESKNENDLNIICDLNNTVSYIENIFTQFVTLYNSNISLNKFEPFI